MFGRLLHPSLTPFILLAALTPSSSDPILANVLTSRGISFIATDRLTLWLLTSVPLVFANVFLGLPACKISEFSCKNSHCVRLDRYCDGGNDCGDNSDEPKYCTVCNRTYYGDIGNTYELNLSGQDVTKTPFLCHLTFTANGLLHGDIVQLIFDAFKVGRFEPKALDGCPDGYMQLSELGRPFTGGSWCGATSGYAVYYSETSTVTVSLKLFFFRQDVPFEFKLRYKFVAQNDAVVRFGNQAAPLERGQVTPGTYCTRNYEECYKKRCRLQSPNYPGMYPRNVTCYWSLRQKDIPTCKHAMIAVRQDTDHKILMKRSLPMARSNRTLRTWRECTAERDHLIFYDGPSTNDPVLVKYCGGDWLPKIISRGPEMLVAFHSSPFSMPLHGSSVTSPLRGFELDVDVIFTDSESLDYSRESKRCEFHINASSQEEEGGVTVGRGGRRGKLSTPKHTLPPHTTCSWTFHGRPGDIVWIYFESYIEHALIQNKGEVEENGTSTMSTPHHLENYLRYLNETRFRDHRRVLAKFDKSEFEYKPTKAPKNTTCTTRLRIWDGGGEWESKSILLADHCDDNPPKICDHTLLGNFSRVTRSCKPEESYTSKGTLMVIKHQTKEGTALHPSSFRLRYEFVDTRLGGDIWRTSQTNRTKRSEERTCSRIFRNIQKGEVYSPRNVFMYGRGGAANLTCQYRIVVEPGHRINLTLYNVSFGESKNCKSDQDPHTGRPRCVSPTYQRSDEEDGVSYDPTDVENRIADLRIWEAPWENTKVPLSCTCEKYNSTTNNPQIILSSSNAIELVFRVTAFNITEDFRHIYFKGTWKSEPISPSIDCAKMRKLTGHGGEIIFNYPYRTRDEMACTDTPYLLEVEPHSSLFLETWGSLLPLPVPGLPSPSVDDPNRCQTKNRIMIYSAKPPRLIKVICPSNSHTQQNAIHIFSKDWFVGKKQFEPLKPLPRPHFVVLFVGREEGSATFKWMEVTKSINGMLQQLQKFEPEVTIDKAIVNKTFGNTLECKFRCPELNACISYSLWCDGVNNCPSGYDEDERHCGVGMKILSQIPGGFYTVMSATASVLAVCILLTMIALIGKYRKIRKIQRQKKTFKNEVINGHKRRLTEEFLLNPSIASSTISS